MFMDEHLNNHIDKLFGEALKFHKDVPSKELWQRIENHLDNEDLIAYKSRFRRRILITIGFFIIVAGFGAIILNNQIQHRSSSASIIKTGNKVPLSVNITGSNHQTETLTANLNPAKKSSNTNHPYVAWLIERNEGGLLAQSLYSSHASLQSSGGHIQIDSTNFELHPVSTKFPVTIKSSFNMNGNDPLTGLKGTENTVIKPYNQNFKSRISVASYFSKEFAGYNLSDDDATAADGREIEKRERNVFSASVGINVNYRIKKRWVIQTGLSYSWSNSIIDSSKSYAVLGNDGIVKYKFNTISGYSFLQPLPAIQPKVGDSVYTANAYSQLHYLTVPVVLCYGIPMKKFSLLIGAGVSFNILTSATVATKIYGLNYSQDESAIPMKGLKKINYGILLKAELEYHINSKLGIDLIPCFKNSLTPINIHSALSAYPYNFGIGVGLSYKF